jgi:hypothetical protein
MAAKNAEPRGVFTVSPVSSDRPVRAGDQHERPRGGAASRSDSNPVQAGSLYITLELLERKGFLTLRSGESEPGRGGRPKRFVDVTEEGVRALSAHRRALLRIWDGLEARLENT